MSLTCIKLVEIQSVHPVNYVYYVGLSISFFCVFKREVLQFQNSKISSKFSDYICLLIYVYTYVCLCLFLCLCLCFSLSLSLCLTHTPSLSFCVYKVFDSVHM